MQKSIDVDYILEGSARSEGRNVRVTAQLIQVKDGTHVWAHTYNGKLQDVLELQREIAETVGNEVRIVITTQARSTAKPRSVNPEAYELYLKGQYFWAQRTEATLKKGLEHFQQAVEKDPTFAPAHVGIALSYSLLEYRRMMSPQVAYANSLAATKRALEIDPCARKPTWHWPTSKTIMSGTGPREKSRQSARLTSTPIIHWHISGMPII